MSLEAVRVKEESDMIADEVIIKEEELEPDCLEVPYVAIEAAIVDVEFAQPVKEDLHSIGFSEPAVYMDGVKEEHELIIPDDLNPECGNAMSLLEADTVSQYADVKDELILEPECIRRPNTGIYREICKPVLTDCWVRIERCEAAEKAAEKQLAELDVKENRVHTLRDDETFLCPKCKHKEQFEFCDICVTNMRALDQLRNLRVKRRKIQFVCELCSEKFQQVNHLYQHKLVIHGYYNNLRMKNPRESYSAYLSRLYSVKTICRSTSNLLHSTNVNTVSEKLMPIEYNEKDARELITIKIGKDVVQSVIVNPENMLPKSDNERKKKPYNCKVCKKPASKEKFCDECAKERVLSNMDVKQVRVENTYNRTLLRIERTPHLRKEKHQTTLARQRLRKTKTRECYVRLERCEAAERALLNNDAIKSEIVGSKSNLTSGRSEEHRCNICKTKTPVGVHVTFCEACEKELAENALVDLIL